ncbi:MAG: competence/damage-inducible protein A [Burkholderiales bacterium]|nr:competence/damage-inducible protein A [Phycisphaerae bacterium]
MNAIILSIGDELVLGQTLDTNSAWLSQQLAGIGCDVAAHRTVADDRAAIAEAIREEAARCDVLLISGGLGPTDDDLTREALADVLGQPLTLRSEWVDELQRFFTRLGRTMPERNKVQAMLPEQADLIWNNNGTAPGIRVKWSGVRREEDSSASQASRLNPQPCMIFAVPGVPKEMKPMFADAIKPWLSDRSGGAVILQKTLHTFGVGESTIAERLGELMKRGRNPSVGTTVSHGVVSLRVNARFESPARAHEEMEQTVKACRTVLGDLIYGEDGDSLSQRVAELLTASGKTVATAESCTGGLLAGSLTDLAGSSRFFRYGWVVYSDEAKHKLLDVSQATLAAHGTVSEQVVRELADHARRVAGADYAVAISGIAGPGGGSQQKPVGTVWFAMSYDGGTAAQRFLFSGDREMIRDRSVKMALTMLRYHLLGKRFPF